MNPDGATTQSRAFRDERAKLVVRRAAAQRWVSRSAVSLVIVVGWGVYGVFRFGAGHSTVVFLALAAVLLLHAGARSRRTRLDMAIDDGDRELEALDLHREIVGAPERASAQEEHARAHGWDDADEVTTKRR